VDSPSTCSDQRQEIEALLTSLEGHLAAAHSLGEASEILDELQSLVAQIRAALYPPR